MDATNSWTLSSQQLEYFFPVRVFSSVRCRFEGRPPPMSSTRPRQKARRQGMHQALPTGCAKKLEREPEVHLSFAWCLYWPFSFQPFLGMRKTWKHQPVIVLNFFWSPLSIDFACKVTQAAAPQTNASGTSQQESVNGGELQAASVVYVDLRQHLSLDGRHGGRRPNVVRLGVSFFSWFLWDFTREVFIWDFTSEATRKVFLWDLNIKPTTRREVFLQDFNSEPTRKVGRLASGDQGRQQSFSFEARPSWRRQTLFIERRDPWW